MSKKEDVLNVERCWNHRIDSGIVFVDFVIAGDEVVLDHRRTLSLSGYLMFGGGVVQTL